MRSVKGKRLSHYPCSEPSSVYPRCSMHGEPEFFLIPVRLTQLNAVASPKFCIPLLYAVKGTEGQEIHNLQVY